MIKEKITKEAITIEEAMNVISNFMSYIDIDFEEKVITIDPRVGIARNVAINSMKKEIPMKPALIDYEASYFECGNCDEAICYMDDKETHKYCLICGQAVLWQE